MHLSAGKTPGKCPPGVYGDTNMSAGSKEKGKFVSRKRCRGIPPSHERLGWPSLALEEGFPSLALLEFA